MEKGRQAGREEERLQISRQLKAISLSASNIAAATRLTEDAIDQL